MGSTDEVRGPVIGTREDKSTKGTFLIYLELSSRGEQMKVDLWLILYCHVGLCVGTYTCPAQITNMRHYITYIKDKES